MSYSFSGHETFSCRNYWLKKGYDFCVQDNSFSDPSAVTKLGVGKNMVSSIKSWMKAFGLIEPIGFRIKDIAHKIFADNEGWDPYLEDINTIWLLHYYLVKTNYASSYSLFFNDFIKQHVEFNVEQFEKYIQFILAQNEVTHISPKSIHADVRVFLNSYQRPEKRKNNIEDDFSGLLQELNFFEKLDKSIYKIVLKNRPNISDELVLFIIRESFNEVPSISFEQLLKEKNSPGVILGLTPKGLYEKIENIVKRYDGIEFSEGAGIRELQFKDSFEMDSFTILDNYYERN